MIKSVSEAIAGMERIHRGRPRLRLSIFISRSPLYKVTYTLHYKVMCDVYISFKERDTVHSLIFTDARKRGMVTTI